MGSGEWRGESGERADAAVHFRGEEGGERDSLLSPLDGLLIVSTDCSGSFNSV